MIKKAIITKWSELDIKGQRELLCYLDYLAYMRQKELLKQTSTYALEVELERRKKAK